MKIGIMQPYFFPYIGYWQLMNVVDKYVIYDDVNYIKGGWINRNRILIGGKAQYIHLLLKGASPNKLINQVGVSNDPIARRKLLSTLKMNYSKAPYWEMVNSVLEKIIRYDADNAAQFLEYQLKVIADYLEIDTEIMVSSDIDKNNGLKGEEKVIEICKILGADTYINAIGGRALYSKDRFHEEGIELRFLQTGDIVYQQYLQEFISDLSIIDVMVFNSKKRVQEMLEEFTLL